MRLLNTDNFEVKEFRDDEVPRYAILSHTWDEEEVTFQDIEGTRAANKKGYEKVKSCCSVARANGLKYVWIDTCCINKTSSAELSEAINSMYRWYQEADVCYSYLADVSSKAIFSGSRWFTRGWTLQELIAPSTVIFLNNEWKEIGTKASLRQDISNCTDIPVSILLGDDDLETVSIAQRMSWAAKRKTSRIEDRAYCLLGIFGINMPLIYGERETAFTRLQEEIMRISDDHSLFAWKSCDNRGGLLATSPAAFIGSGNIVQFNPFDTFNSPLTMSSRGIHLELRFIGIGPRGLGLAILHCKERGGEDKPIAIYVKDLFLTMDRFERVWSEEFERLNLRKFRPSQYAIRRICIRKGHMTRMQKSKDFKKCDSISPEEIYPNNTLINLLNLGERTALLRAAEKGLDDVVWLLLTQSDVEANLGDEDGRTALSHAVSGGHKMVVKMLLARSDVKADLEAKDGRTPLSRAAENGHEAVVKLLLETGKVDVESSDEYGRTPLSWAAEGGHEAVVKLLLETGKFDVESKDEYGRSPLSWAVEGGHEAVVKLLLETGKVDVESKDKYSGRTPLSWAAARGHKAVVKLLRQSI
jgi:ankyrin repeat protein